MLFDKSPFENIRCSVAVAVDLIGENSFSLYLKVKRGMEKLRQRQQQRQAATILTNGKEQNNNVPSSQNQGSKFLKSLKSIKMNTQENRVSESSKT